MTSKGKSTYAAGHPALPQPALSMQRGRLGRLFPYSTLSTPIYRMQLDDGLITWWIVLWLALFFHLVHFLFMRQATGLVLPTPGMNTRAEAWAWIACVLVCAAAALACFILDLVGRNQGGVKVDITFIIGKTATFFLLLCNPNRTLFHLGYILWEFRPWRHGFKLCATIQAGLLVAGISLISTETLNFFRREAVLWVMPLPAYAYLAGISIYLLDKLKKQSREGEQGREEEEQRRRRWRLLSLTISSAVFFIVSVAIFAVALRGLITWHHYFLQCILILLHSLEMGFWDYRRYSLSGNASRNLTEGDSAAELVQGLEMVGSC